MGIYLAVILLYIWGNYNNMKNQPTLLRFAAILIFAFLMAACGNQPGGNASAAQTDSTTSGSAAAGNKMAAAPPPSGACGFTSGKIDSPIAKVTDITVAFDQTSGDITLSHKGVCFQVIPSGTTRSWYVYTTGGQMHFVDSPSVTTIDPDSCFRWPLSSTLANAGFSFDKQGTTPKCAIGIGTGDLRNGFSCPHNAVTIKNNIDNAGSSPDQVVNFVTVNTHTVASSLILFVSQSKHHKWTVKPTVDNGTCPANSTIVGCP